MLPIRWDLGQFPVPIADDVLSLDQPASDPPHGERHERRIEHLELHRNILAVEPDRIDVGFQLAQYFVVCVIGKCSRLEIGREADVQHIRRVFRRTKSLRVGRTERHELRPEALPDLRVGIGFFQIHVRQGRNPFEIGQRRHVHDREARQLRLGDFVGFVLDDCCEHHSFQSREKAIGEVVLRALKERLAVSVLVTKGRARRIIRLIIKN